MIGICPRCGDHSWNKTISNDGKIINCQKCGNEWGYKALPLFILTGCSGVGKTTTALELLLRDTNYLIMDADYFSFMGNDYQARAEQLLNLSKNLMQGGKPLLWTMAGALEKLDSTYNRRFFKDIYYLSLVCDNGDLKAHMKEGRGIKDERWIQSSIDHNTYLMHHDSIDNVAYEKFDITGRTVAEAADYVDFWVNAKINGNALFTTKIER